MSLCHNCDLSRIEYTGTGSVTQYTFPFEYYNKDTDVKVANKNQDSTYTPIDDSLWSFVNATTIRFNQAPENGKKFMIYRCTDITPMPAEFYPGNSIKADDLNTNFFVLQSAIEETRCSLSKVSDEVDRRITKQEQETGAWVGFDDGRIASSDAIRARHDAHVTDVVPPEIVYEQPGKAWENTDKCWSSYWNTGADAWVAYVNTGPRGLMGPKGATGDSIVGPPGPVGPSGGLATYTGSLPIILTGLDDATIDISISEANETTDGYMSKETFALLNGLATDTINDTLITVRQGGVVKGTFTTNQTDPSFIDLDAGSGDGGSGNVISVNGQDGVVSLSIDNLTDVDTSSADHIPTDGQALVWKSAMSHWMPETIGGSGGSLNIGLLPTLP